MRFSSLQAACPLEEYRVFTPGNYGCGIWEEERYSGNKYTLKNVNFKTTYLQGWVSLWTYVLLSSKQEVQFCSWGVTVSVGTFHKYGQLNIVRNVIIIQN